jgi:hypothetical protein
MLNVEVPQIAGLRRFGERTRELVVGNSYLSMTMRRVMTTSPAVSR